MSSTSDVTNFLCDVLVYDNFKDIPNVETYFTPEGLSYQQLFKSPRVHEILKINFVFERMFGNVCPWPLMYDIINNDKPIVSATFLQFMPSDSSVIRNLDKIEKESDEFVYELRRDIQLVSSSYKRYLSKRWFGSTEQDVSLYRMYCSRDVNPIKQLDLLRSGSEFVPKDLIASFHYLMSPYDIVTFKVVRDYFLQRILLESDVLYIDVAIEKNSNINLRKVILGVLANAKQKKIIAATETIHEALGDLDIHYTPVYVNEHIPMQILFRFCTNNVHFISTNVNRIMTIGKDIPTTKLFSYYLSNSVDTNSNLPANAILVVDPFACNIKSILKNYPDNFIAPITDFDLATPYIRMILEAHQNRTARRLHLKSLVYKSALSCLSDAVKKLEKDVHSPASKNTKCIILADNRKNPLSFMSLIISLSNVAHPRDWDIKVVTLQENTAYYEKLSTYIPSNSVDIVTHKILSREYFDIEAYNLLLKDSSFWEMFKDYDRCLLVQDDGIIVAPGVDAFLEYDYVGSPWIVCPDNDELNQMTEKMVGNGGLSVRSIPMMISVTSKYIDEKTNPFNRCLQPIPEDVYFSVYVEKEGGKVPYASTARSFACEQIFDINACGFHKFWAYCSEYDVIAYCKKMVSQ